MRRLVKHELTIIYVIYNSSNFDLVLFCSYKFQLINVIIGLKLKKTKDVEMGTTTKKRKFARLMKDTFLQKAKIHWLPGVDYVTVVNPKVTFINTLGYLVHYL